MAKEGIHGELVDIFAQGGPCVSFGGPIDALPPQPGLFIQGTGDIAVPAEEAAAMRIMAVARRSSESYKIAAANARFDNPQWEAGVETLRQLVATELNVELAQIRLKLVNLLLCPEGGRFESSCDAEHAKGMFGTLVVQLPSIHEGGDLVVNESSGPLAHLDDTGGTARFRWHYAFQVSHYGNSFHPGAKSDPTCEQCADSEHTAEKVSKGFRLALIYSVCWSIRWWTPSPSKGLVIQRQEKLAASLRRVF